MALVPQADLVTAFQAALPVPVISHTAATAGYDLYEVYLFGLCVRAAESIGLDVDFADASGNSATSLTLRTSPSTIWSAVQQFTHARLSLDGEVLLEAHLGIYIRSASGVSHEADVAIIDAGEATRARILNTNPRIGRTALAIEAKFYATNVRLRTGREFLGLGVDLGVDSTVFASSAPGESVHRMFSYRKRPSHFELVPGSNQEAEFKSRVAIGLRDYLAKAT